MELIAACIITVVVLQTGWSFHTACNDCQSQVLAEPKMCMKYSEECSEECSEEEQVVVACSDTELNELLDEALEIAKASNSNNKLE